MVTANKAITVCNHIFPACNFHSEKNSDYTGQAKNHCLVESHLTGEFFVQLFNFCLLFSFLLGFFEGLPAYLGSMVVFTAVVLIYILNTDANPSVKLSWCILIGILPIFGTALYFYVQSDLGHRMVKRIVNSSVAESLPHVENPPEPETTPDIAHYLKTQAHAFIYENSDVRYFPLGEEAFEEMLAQMERAEKYIFLEYFIIEPGLMWNRMLDILIRKAREGVEVRVLYDGTCAVTTLPANYPKQLEALGQSHSFNLQNFF